jgi:ATPase subunit of ABC transporter with duplicated ATPase domains
VTLVTCAGTGVEYGDRVVFSGLELSIEPGDRIGLVGSNGQGKSSLLMLLAGTQLPAQGRVDRQARLLVAYLPQESPEPVAETVLGEAMASRTDLARLRDELAHLERQLSAAGPEADAHLSRYGQGGSGRAGAG